MREEKEYIYIFVSDINKSIKMNDRYILLPLHGYLKEWLYNKFGNPVRFPKYSYQHAILATFLRPLPKYADNNLVDKDGVRIYIPNLENKQWQTYNYLCHEGESKLMESIEYLFRVDLLELFYTIHQTGIRQRLNDWCKSRDISFDNREAIRQKMYRMHHRYERNNIVIGTRYNKE